MGAVFSTNKTYTEERVIMNCSNGTECKCNKQEKIKAQVYYSKSIIGKFFEFVTGMFLIITTIPIQILYVVGTFAKIIGDKLAELDEFLCRKCAEFFG